MQFGFLNAALALSLLLASESVLASSLGNEDFGHGTLVHRAAKKTKCTKNSDCSKLGKAYECNTSTSAKTKYCYKPPTECKKDSDCTSLGSTYTCGPSEICIKPAQDEDQCIQPSGCQSHFCSPSGVCKTTKGKLNGSSCSKSSQCKSNACVHSECTDRLAEGKKCIHNKQCTSLICERANGRCGPVPSDSGDINQTCLHSSDCASGYCGYGYCLTPKSAGEDCYKNSGCTSGLCGTDGECSSGKDIDNGDKCTMSKQCSSGFCKSNRCSKQVGEGSKCTKQQACEDGLKCSDDSKCVADDSD